MYEQLCKILDNNDIKNTQFLVEIVVFFLGIITLTFVKANHICERRFN